MLKPNIGVSNLVLHCEQALAYEFCCVCVNSVHVAYVHSILDRSTVDICSTVNFPLGSSSSYAVCQEAYKASEDGASEIDTVINISFLKSGYYDRIIQDLQMLRNVTKGKILKVIFENCLLNEEEKIKACEICCDVGVDYIKTSTGFSISGASIEDVILMKQHSAGTSIKIKAAGGIRDYQTALYFIEAGASRIGTSNGVAIVTDSDSCEEY